MLESKTPAIFKDHIIFSTIASYLSIKDILKLSTVSYQIRSIIENHLKILQKQLHMKTSNHKSAIHQMQFYFNRCLTMIRDIQTCDNTLNNNIQQKTNHLGSMNNKILTTIYHPFKFQTMKIFQVGTLFTCYLTRDQKATLFRTSHLLKIFEQKKEQKYLPENQTPNFHIFKGVRDIRCKSQTVLLTKTNGEVVLVSGKNADPQIFNEQATIPWTTRLPIKFVLNSFNFTIFIPENPFSLTSIYQEVFNLECSEQNQDKHDKTYFVAKNMLNQKEFIIQIACSQVLKSTVGSRYAYFISQKNQLFEIDLQQQPETETNIIKAKIFDPLKDKSIAKIYTGYNYFIAIERNLQPLTQWNTQKVVQWLKSIGFDEFIKIAKVEKLDGKKLSEIEKKYMHNVLGITKTNMQQKFIMSIDQQMNKKAHEDKIWGWGQNSNGQLGSSSANFIVKPQKIRFDCLQQNEYIDTIFCGWFQTFVRTQKGRIFCTMVKSQKRRKQSERQTHQKQQADQQYHIIENNKVQNSSESEEEADFKFDRANQKNKNRNKPAKKKKQGHETSSIPLKSKAGPGHHRRFEEEEKWFQLPLGKAFFVQTYKDVVFLIQCPNKNKEQPNKVKKLRTAKAILDKILWSNYNKEEFKVGYLDKEMGLIEASALDMQKFEVKQNRIKYFKRGKVIIWDRDNKIDLF